MGQTRRKPRSDLYTDDNPKNTIPIRFKTVDDVKRTIQTLKRLRRTRRYSQKRIKMVALVLYGRLKVVKDTKPIQYRLAKNYYMELNR